MSHPLPPDLSPSPRLRTAIKLGLLLEARDRGLITESRYQLLERHYRLSL